MYYRILIYIYEFFLVCHINNNCILKYFRLIVEKVTNTFLILFLNAIILLKINILHCLWL